MPKALLQHVSKENDENTSSTHRLLSSSLASLKRQRGNHGLDEHALPSSLGRFFFIVPHISFPLQDADRLLKCALWPLQFGKVEEKEGGSDYQSENVEKSSTRESCTHAVYIASTHWPGVCTKWQLLRIRGAMNFARMGWSMHRMDLFSRVICLVLKSRAICQCRINESLKSLAQLSHIVLLLLWALDFQPCLTHRQPVAVRLFVVTLLLTNDG